MLEEDLSFLCPHCGAALTLRIDCTGGGKQSFTHDCETCCNPIDIRLELEDEEVIYFSAEKES